MKEPATEGIMRTTVIGLITTTLLTLIPCAEACAREREVEARVYGMKIAGSDAETITAAASFAVTGPPGREYQLGLKIRIHEGEYLKQADGQVLIRTGEKVTMPAGKTAATWEDCRVALSLLDLGKSKNLASGGSTRLAVLFFLRDLTAGTDIADNRAHPVPLVVTTSAERLVTKVQHLETWSRDLGSPDSEVVHAASHFLLTKCRDLIPKERIGRAAAAAVRLLGDYDFREPAQQDLLTLEAAATAALVGGLKSREPRVRAWSGATLLRLGVHGRAATLAVFDGIRQVAEEDVHTYWALCGELKEIRGPGA